MTMSWCLGFVFNQDLSEVLLLRKGRTLHVGTWNGLGGQLEGDETPAEAMHRETEEEAGLKIYPPFWEYVGTIGFPKGDRVHVFGSWIADLSHRFQNATTISQIDWPSDKPLAVPIAQFQHYEFAPHVEILIYAATLKIKDPNRDLIHIREVARF
jgi:ADP-ribose pyrophosphatase YjhB (NUDIX family)